MIHIPETAVILALALERLRETNCHNEYEI